MARVTAARHYKSCFRSCHYEESTPKGEPWATCYRERLGFQLDFQGPESDPYYAGVSRDGIGLMLKAIVPDVLPQPNHTRHEWARWDAYIYTLDPDVLFDEFSQRGVSFVVVHRRGTMGFRDHRR